MKVVTYQTTRNERINICPACEKRLLNEHEWPKGRTGEDFSTVYMGLHRGYCDVHPVRADPPPVLKAMP